jgi:hypothetical protein
MLELSKYNKIYRKRAGSLILRSKRNNRKFDHFFVFCNYNISVAIMGSLLVSFEYSITVEFNCCVNLIINN